ncbi:putative regulator of chromosome condensation family protein [Brevibacillus phage SecTim467]|uniref:Putative regulator of chromosome condensation family protein n=2 Tax=Jenstvirus jenst TaxID=1982225 RepID=A0A0K2CPK6_9CAUD|nr:regulator of chromosome condensation [Brevibacillus phage Jenst]ALA07181.1 putative regulator of chromosome condenstation family protein [Brevibacillus phage Jenst]ALA07550.1 putative regulator of chromosome condensation family protein [Brevibacillus phage SecTim467]
MSGQSSYHGLFIKNDGAVYGVGYNHYGQLAQERNVNTSNVNWQPQISKGLSNVKMVAQGMYHSLILSNNGELYSVGYNYYGQLGTTVGWRTQNAHQDPVLIMADVKEIACGYLHSVVLKDNGDVYTFGYGNFGQLGNGSYNDVSVPQKVATNAKHVGAGNICSFYISQDDKLYGCGYNKYGNLGLSNTADHYQWTYIMSDIKQVDGGVYHSLFLTLDGKALACGYNYYGQLGTNVGAGLSTAYPQPREIMQDVKQVVGGGDSTYIVTSSGDLYTVGRSNYGQLGSGSYSDINYQLKKVRSNVRQVAAGYYHSHVLDNDGKVYGAGWNLYGQVGVSNNTGTNAPNPNYLFVTDNVRKLYGTLESVIRFTDVSVTSSFHKEDVSLTMNIGHVAKDLVSYRILVNNTQKFPNKGWTPPQNTNFILTKLLPHSFFDLGDNVLALEVKDSSSSAEAISFNITKVNQNPAVSPLLSSTTVHKDNVRVGGSVSDIDGDKVQYRVLLNNVQKYPTLGFTELMPSPANIGVVINNADLSVGANTLKIEAKDDLGALTTWSQVIIKMNTAPNITGDVFGNFINLQVADSDRDKVQYRIIFNGVQLYPQDGYTEYAQTPFDIKYTIPRQLVKKGINNTVRVETVDELNGYKAWEKNFTGAYSGLMFCDATETFYSDDFGDILKYLDFGTIVAGQTTAAERVFIKNTLGYPVENLRIWVNHRELDGLNAKAEISKLDAPFQALPELKYVERINHNEKISFYVRVATTRQAMWGGMFDVLTKADPAMG